MLFSRSVELICVEKLKLHAYGSNSHLPFCLPLAICLCNYVNVNIMFSWEWNCIMLILLQQSCFIYTVSLEFIHDVISFRVNLFFNLNLNNILIDTEQSFPYVITHWWKLGFFPNLLYYAWLHNEDTRANLSSGSLL